MKTNYLLMGFLCLILNTAFAEKTPSITAVNTLKYGSTIALKSYHGKYMVGEHSGALNANRTRIGSLEKFIIYKAGNPNHRGTVYFGDKVSLKSAAKNKYIVGEDNGKANANRSWAKDLERFTIQNPLNKSKRSAVTSRSKVAFLGFHRKYLVAEQNGNVNANRTQLGPWEQWTILPQNVAKPKPKPKPVVSQRPIYYGSTIALKSSQGKYMVGEHDGSLNANRSRVGSLEKFIIYKKGNKNDRGTVKYGDKVSLKSSAKNKYVVGEHNGTANANRDAARSLETFILVKPSNPNSRGTVYQADKVAFRTLHNKYLVAEHNGAANANRTRLGSLEQWTLLTQRPNPVKKTPAPKPAPKPVIHNKPKPKPNPTINNPNRPLNPGEHIKTSASHGKGYIKFINEAGYVARFTLFYTYNGKRTKKQYKLSLGQSKKIEFPSSSKNIVVRGEANTISSWKRIFNKKTGINKCFKAYGTVFAPKWKNCR